MRASAWAELGGDRLAQALALIVAGVWTERIHIAVIVFGLRMDEGVAIRLRGGGHQEARAHAARAFEQPHRTLGVDTDGLEWMLPVADRAGGAGEVEHSIRLELPPPAAAVAPAL